MTKPARTPEEAREDLARLRLYLEAAAERLEAERSDQGISVQHPIPAALGTLLGDASAADRDLLRWAAKAIGTYLAELAALDKEGDEGGRRRRRRSSASLEHAFGIVDSRGNPGGQSKYLPLAIERYREGLTVEALMERHEISSDERTVRAGLASVDDDAISVLASEQADAADAKRRAERAARVDQYHRENNIQPQAATPPENEPRESGATSRAGEEVPSLLEIEKNWRGPVVSKVDGKMLKTPQQLHAHMLEQLRRSPKGV